MISPYVFAGLGSITNKQELSEIICNRFGISLEQLTSAKRTRHLVTARMWYAYVLRMFLKKEFKAIGRDLGGRDHSTIIHYMHQMKGFLEVSEDDRKEFMSFVSSINHSWSAQLQKSFS